MSDTATALRAGDQLLDELAGRGFQRVDGTKLAPTMGMLKKVAYTHEAMIDLIIEGSSRPGGISQSEIAKYFGYSESWISNILASDAFQIRLVARRSEIVDPTLAATIKERTEALVRRSLDILMAKLNKPEVSDTVALKAYELGARAMGLGANAPAPTRDDAADRLERIAHRLISLQSGVRQGKVVDGEILNAEGHAQRQPLPLHGPRGQDADEGSGAQSAGHESAEGAVRADGGGAGAEGV